MLAAINADERGSDLARESTDPTCDMEACANAFSYTTIGAISSDSGISIGSLGGSEPAGEDIELKSLPSPPQEVKYMTRPKDQMRQNLGRWPLIWIDAILELSILQRIPF